MFVFMDWRHDTDLLIAARNVGLEHKNTCVWVKDNAGMGTFYRSQHEFVIVFKNGAGSHINNFGLGGKGRYRTNVWHAPGVNTFRAGRLSDLEAHPTCKPTLLYAEAMKDCSRSKGIVLDTFAGSGTVFLAADRTGRRARGMEIDPHYCDVAIRRWEQAANAEAVHEATGRTFRERSSGTGREDGQGPVEVVV
jgi:DNA modification methylase